ncbi:response regulator [Waterburya agarophytonicola K14]|uniref:Response regulator n=1 Tax=Waterburya agarophytonicola KI4 TaxID=2874699 RepID=A0A964BSU9_9CYAN|nr:response regulator [Waterburya agarophytonicola]MCC0179073.1 response regulator [Waterburya agarophytonicola KI4]
MISTSLLVIDDDGDFNDLVKFVLEHDTDWKIFTALDGEKGVALAQLQQPDIILLDIIMPNLNGLDVYHLLKSNPNTCSIPIIFVTAMVRMEPIIRAQITEDIEVITKPFDIMTLANQVINVCDRYLVTNQ